MGKRSKISVAYCQTGPNAGSDVGNMSSFAEKTTDITCLMVGGCLYPSEAIVNTSLNLHD